MKIRFCGYNVIHCACSLLLYELVKSTAPGWHRTKSLQTEGKASKASPDKNIYFKINSNCLQCTLFMSHNKNSMCI